MSRDPIGQVVILFLAPTLMTVTIGMVFWACLWLTGVHDADQMDRKIAAFLLGGAWIVAFFCVLNALPPVDKEKRL